MRFHYKFTIFVSKKHTSFEKKLLYLLWLCHSILYQYAVCMADRNSQYIFSSTGFYCTIILPL